MKVSQQTTKVQLFAIRVDKVQEQGPYELGYVRFDNWGGDNGGIGGPDGEALSAVRTIAAFFGSQATT